ncbi:MAG: GTPase ObgE [Lachnospiraceae bacterium]|nr:GTPase ObgE [Lachnospiraceae bacterium]
MFADRVKIHIRSGKGGDGHVSFRRELYVAAGGPDGGDGGNGGDLIFEVDPGINTLNDYRYNKKYSAGDGAEGFKQKMHGKDGEDCVLKVPEGTVIKEAETGKVIVDMSHDIKRYTVLKGGRGGKGNVHYATPTMQVPKYAQPGKPCKELDVILELKLIADVGLLGFPNVGKSTFLSVVSNAKPKIANYHFTTLTPSLGVVDMPDGKGFVIADIPGLIEGANEGVGLGHQFLRHVERTKVFIHMIDAASVEGRDPIEDVYTINEELKKHDPTLLERPQIIAANKADVFVGTEEDTVITLLKEEFEPEIPVMSISCATKKGIRELLFKVQSMLDSIEDEPTVFESEYDPEEHVGLIDENIKVYYDEAEDEYVIEGEKVLRMLGYTNLDSEKGFDFFQKFMKNEGILEELEKLEIEEGDTVRLYDLSFEYYK